MAIEYTSLKQRVYALFCRWDSYGCASARQELEILFKENPILREGSKLREKLFWLEKELGIIPQN